MNAPAIPDPPSAIETLAGFAAAITWGLGAAHARGARRLLLVDRDFADWPLSEPDVLQTIQAWVRLPQRKLVLLAADFDELPRRHPRFLTWRRDWAHAVEAFAAPAELSERLPCVLVDDGPVCVQRFAGPQVRGRAEMNAQAARRWRDEIDAALQQSSPALPVQTLGL
jgi:hypothetical protein